MRNDRTDVLVVGAGPVGMLTALLLTESGIQTRIIDQEWRTASRAYACALHPRTLQLLDRLGLTAELMAAGRRIATVGFYEGESRRAELKFSELPVPFPFVLVLPQSALEDLLQKRLSGGGKHEVEWNHRLSELRPDGDAMLAVIDKLGVSAKGYIVPEMEWSVERTDQVRATFIVGADGANSSVARSLDVRFESRSEAEFYAVYEFESDWDAGNELRIVLDQGTASVLWPLPDNRFRWSFQLRDEHLREFPTKERSSVRVQQPGLERENTQFVEKLIRQRAPWFKGAIGAIDWATDAEFEHRLAKRFGQGRCWLTGDAAHQTGPAGMQSMNAGLAEAEELCGALKKILLEKAPLDLLETYNANCRAEWQQLLGMSGGLKARPRTNEWVKERSARILSCIPASGAELKLLANQLQLDCQ